MQRHEEIYIDRRANSKEPTSDNLVHAFITRGNSARRFKITFCSCSHSAGVSVKLLGLLVSMVKHLIVESARKQLKNRSGNGRGVARVSWSRYWIEGPLRPHERWPAGAEAGAQGHTNCRLLTQLCSDKAGCNVGVG